jgi:hypothetical protein
MEQQVLSLQPHELASLAGKHGTTEERVRQLAVASGSQSRRELEEVLELSSRLLRQDAIF